MYWLVSFIQRIMLDVEQILVEVYFPDSEDEGGNLYHTVEFCISSQSLFRYPFRDWNIYYLKLMFSIKTIYLLLCLLLNSVSHPREFVGLFLGHPVTYYYEKQLTRIKITTLWLVNIFLHVKLIGLPFCNLFL